MTREYVYKVAAIEKITDGDTYWLHLDVGFRQTQLTHIRLANFDTPEANRGSDFEKAEAQRAKALVIDWFTKHHGGGIWCCTQKDPDNFGRWLGELWVEYDGSVVALLGSDLAHEGLATPWPTRWREVFDGSRS